MEHPEVAYRLARDHLLELERAVAASRGRSPAYDRLAGMIGAVAARLARRPASLSARPDARQVPGPRSEARSPLVD